MKIAVCALTFKRPDGLTLLIEGLAGLTFAGEPPDIAVIIVDNDPQASARETCERLARDLPWPLRYVVEPQRGIAPARNTALDNVGDAEWIAFLDDDEVPAPNWLDELMRIQREHDADVATGPIIPYTPEPTPDWIERGDFLQQIRHATGTQLDCAYTNNVLFRTSILEEMGIRFDDRWALMGGEDSHFFERIGIAGYKIIWNDEALVTEWIPASRANARWILQRAYRNGNVSVCVKRDIYPERRPHGYLVIRALKRIVRGAFFLPLSWLWGRHRTVTELRHIWYGVGMMSGWLGLHYNEYRKTHGS